MNGLLKIFIIIFGCFDCNWYLSYIICYFIIFLGVFFGVVFVFSLLVVVINRYFVILLLLNYMDWMLLYLVKIFLVLIWFGSFCLVILLVMWREKEVICCSGKIFEEYYMFEVLYFFLVLWFFVIVIFCIVMSVLYVKIYLIVWYYVL